MTSKVEWQEIIYKNSTKRYNLIIIITNYNFTNKILLQLQKTSNKLFNYRLPWRDLFIYLLHLFLYENNKVHVYEYQVKIRIKVIQIHKSHTECVLCESERAPDARINMSCYGVSERDPYRINQAKKTCRKALPPPPLDRIYIHIHTHIL